MRFSLRSLVVGLLLFASSMGLSRAWDPWKPYAQVCDDGSVMFGVFSPSDRRVAVAGIGPHVRVLDVTTGKEKVRWEITSTSGSVEYVDKLAFSPDGKVIGVSYVYSPVDSQGLACWDTTTGQTMLNVNIGSATPDSIGISVFRGAYFLEAHLRNGEREIKRTWQLSSGQEVAPLTRDLIIAPSREITLDGSKKVVIHSYRAKRRYAYLCRLSRPTQWYGLLWLRELWATVFFGALLAWSIWRDRKYFRSMTAKPAETLPE